LIEIRVIVRELNFLEVGRFDEKADDDVVGAFESNLARSCRKRVVVEEKLMKLNWL
jgi:hypothetical protein